MKVFGDSKSDKELSGKYILLDNDFLNQLFRDPEVLVDFILRFDSSAGFLIDTLTEFEFSRDIYNFKQRKAREEFIAKSIFYPTRSVNYEIFNHLLDNALLLSRIYSQQKQGEGKSFTDLMLAAITMLQSNTTVLITGNKKHFPLCIFDTLTVYNVEQDGDGSMRAYCVVSFNQNKFKKYLEQLKLSEKGSLKTVSFHIESNKEDINPDDIPF